MKTNGRTYNLVLVALLTALTYVATVFIYIPNPISLLTSGGMIHFGNVIIVVSAIVFGKNKAAVSAAFGMALFDLTSPYAIWAPFTFVIRGAMGYTLGTSSHMKNYGSNVVFNIIAITAASTIQIVGYYFAEVIIYRNWITPIASMSGELAQIVVAFVGLPIAMIINKAMKPYK
jgi:uncharacterized membrane protein